MSETTTNVSELKDGKPFTWGEVKKIHEIGEYEIIEYKNSDDEVWFYPNIIGRSINNSFNTLDKAIIGVIAHKYEGALIIRDDHYFSLMIKM